MSQTTQGSMLPESGPDQSVPEAGRPSRRWDMKLLVDVGQLVGALGVVLSLLYVANEFSRAQALSSNEVEDLIFGRVLEMNRMVAESDDMASLIHHARTDPASLDPVHRTRYLAYEHIWFDIWESTYDSHEYGILSDAAWGEWEEWFIAEARSRPAMVWRENRHHFTGAFRDYVDAALTGSPGGAVGAGKSSGTSGVRLSDMTWLEAEAALGPETIVVLPLGAEAKEHGPHLRLDNDRVMADYLTRRVLERADVVVAPTLPYHFYPAFLEYPGSTHLAFDTSRDLVVDIVRSLAGYGPRRFYVLNTGVSTFGPLRAAADTLRGEGILMHFTDIINVAAGVEDQVREQERGTHADEIETSMMLYIAPDRVDMALAVREDNERRGRGGLTRDPSSNGIVSESGVWGDATLATLQKGRLIVEATVEGILREIEALRSVGLPEAGVR